MKYLANPQLNLARKYAHQVIDTKNRIGSRILEFIDESTTLFSSSEFTDEEQIEWGNGCGEFSYVSMSIISEKYRRNDQKTVLVWDNGFSEPDIEESSQNLYVRNAFPDLMQSVPLSGILSGSQDLKLAVLNCISFYPVIILSETQNVDMWHRGIEMIIASAFDQEGAIAWC